MHHVLAVPSRVYRRCRLLGPAFSAWRAAAAAETHRIHARHAAARVLQRAARACSARRKVKAILPGGSPPAVTASRAIQRAARGYLVRRRAGLRRAPGRGLGQGDDRREWLREAREEGQRRASACLTVQAWWRGVGGRREGAVRGRQRLRRVLLELGGGRGRLHR